jgi:hypothetical protein
MADQVTKSQVLSVPPFSFRDTAMNLDPISNVASEIASLFPAGFWPDLAADDGTGLLMSALAGIAAALAVALALAVYFRTGHRSFRDIVRHGLGVAIALGLLAFAAYDIRNAAHADLAKTSLWSATEFELHWQKATARARELATEMDQRARSLPEARQG